MPETQRSTAGPNIYSTPAFHENLIESPMFIFFLLNALHTCAFFLPVECLSCADFLPVERFTYMCFFFFLLNALHVLFSSCWMLIMRWFSSCWTLYIHALLFLPVECFTCAPDRLLGHMAHSLWFNFFYCI